MEAVEFTSGLSLRNLPMHVFPPDCLVRPSAWHSHTGSAK